jgi:hypothetical protein
MLSVKVMQAAGLTFAMAAAVWPSQVPEQDTSMDPSWLIARP